jgi:hypothetical protein
MKTVKFPSHLARLLRSFHPLLLVFLLIALCQALLYTFLIPPWWHYDEPGHFEFAWQIVHFDHWPRPNEWDETVRRQIAASMLQYGYYKPLNYKPDFSSPEPVFIGVAPQYTDYPLYYLIASLPLRFLSGADFAIQNRAVRLVSVILFLVTIWVTWKAVGELLPEGHPIQWMVTLFVILLPGFTDTMTAINDDVGAALAFSLFVWASLRIMRRGFSWQRFLGLILAISACFWTKNTTWPAVGFGPLVLLLSIFRGRARWIIWGMVLIGVTVALLLTLRWGDARFWYRGASQDENTRMEYNQAPLGRYVFHLHYRPGQTEPWIGQFISARQIRPLRDKNVTLGAWIWASEPVEIHLPVLRTAIYKSGIEYSPSQTISITTTPAFYSLSFKIPYAAENGWLEIIPSPPLKNNELHIYLDGIVLVEGTYTGIPQFTDPFAQSGIWDGQPFRNQVRGASAEFAWLWINPSLHKIIQGKRLPFAPDILLASLQDWPAQNAYYRNVLSKLLWTFWGHPARDKVNLPGAPLIYEVLQWVTALGLIGAAFFLWRKARLIPWTEVIVLGLMVLVVWGITAIRGSGSLLTRYPLVPWARYAFPAIIPTALLLCVGWREILTRLGHILKLSLWQQNLIFVSFMVTLDLFALLGIARYFYWKKEQDYTFLFLLVIFLLYLVLRPLYPQAQDTSPYDQ